MNIRQEEVVLHLTSELKLSYLHESHHRGFQLASTLIRVCV